VKYLNQRATRVLLFVLLLTLLFPIAVTAQQSSDGRINVVHHFGGDAFYCVDRNNNPTGQYSDGEFGGMRLLNSAGNVLWFLPAADISAAVETAISSGDGVLVGRGDGTYGPAWLYTYVDGSGNVKFVFSGYDEYMKVNSMEFTYCQPVGPAPYVSSDSEEPDCPPFSSPDGLGEPAGDSGCNCDDDEATWFFGECVVLQVSDVNLKQNFASVDSRRVLELLASLPVSEWSYNSSPDVRHIGPMAQDFMTTFGLGNDPTRINTVDASGVSIAAMQGLYQLATEQQAQIEALEARNTAVLALAVVAVLLATATSIVTVVKLRR
jgi:hypothetical protein